MTFDELNKKLGGGENKSDWRQAKGGGWLNKTAKVDDETKITENAIVWGVVYGDAQVSGNAWVSGNAQVYGDAWVSGNAQVYGDARVSGNAQVYGDAWVSGNAQVSGNARVSGNAQVSGNAWVYGDARVSGNAQVSGNARVSGNAWEKSPLFIIGSRWSLTNAKHGHIQIGCHCETFKWWKANRTKLCKEHNLSKEETKEYFAYIDLFCKIGK